MTKKHDALLKNVLGDLPEKQELEGDVRLESRGSSRFTARSSALAERLSGSVVEKTLHLVDPERCRLWPRHNRRYELLNETRCSDLIEGFKAQGQQEFPAIVRRTKDDPEHDFEIICGARRFWTVCWLRQHNYRHFRFLIEIRDLSDEEAFRLSDVENRDREDICDYERALDYAKALLSFYGGKQKEMASRLEVSETWLSRYLGLAKLPTAIVEAYRDVTDIRERHARELKPLLAIANQREAILGEARSIADEQKERAIEGAAVINRLKRATRQVRPTVKGRGRDYHDKAGRLILKARGKKGAGLTLDIKDIHDVDAVFEACKNAIRDFSGS